MTQTQFKKRNQNGNRRQQWNKDSSQSQPNSRNQHRSNYRFNYIGPIKLEKIIKAPKILQTTTASISKLQKIETEMSFFGDIKTNTVTQENIICE